MGTKPQSLGGFGYAGSFLSSQLPSAASSALEIAFIDNGSGNPPYGSYVFSDGVSWQPLSNNATVDLSAYATNAGVNSQVSTLTGQINGLNTGKQNTLAAGTNIKTVNGSSLLGAGDLPVVASVSDHGLANVKLAQVATKTYLGRTSAATGDVENVTLVQLGADIASLYSPNNLGTTTIALTYAANANHPNRATPAASQVVSIDTTGGAPGNLYPVTNLAAAGSGITITMPSGFVIQPQNFGCDEWNGSTVFISTVNTSGSGGGGGGGASSPVVIAPIVAGANAIGNQLTATVTAGYLGGLQWQENISGTWTDIASQTAATYTITTASRGYRCKISTYYFSNTITSAVSVGTTTIMWDKFVAGNVPLDARAPDTVAGPDVWHCINGFDHISYGTIAVWESGEFTGTRYNPGRKDFTVQLIGQYFNVDGMSMGIYVKDTGGTLSINSGENSLRFTFTQSGSTNIVTRRQFVNGIPDAGGEVPVGTAISVPIDGTALVEVQCFANDTCQVRIGGSNVGSSFALPTGTGWAQTGVRIASGHASPGSPGTDEVKITTP